MGYFSKIFPITTLIVRVNFYNTLAAAKHNKNFKRKLANPIDFLKEGQKKGLNTY